MVRLSVWSDVRIGLIGLVVLAACKGTSPVKEVVEEHFQATRPAVAMMRELERESRSLLPAAEVDRAQRERLQAQVEALIAAEPKWLTPRRLLDDMRREALLGPWMYAEHQAAWRAERDAGAGYLLGRMLNGQAALDVFNQVVERDPRNVWGWHGLAWQAGQDTLEGRSERAFVAALQLVADHQELMTVVMARVRRLEIARQFEDALDLVSEARSLPGWDPVDRTIWQATRLRLELAKDNASLSLQITNGAMTFERNISTATANRWFDVLALLDSQSLLPDSEALTLLNAALATDLDRSRDDMLIAAAQALRGRTSARVAARLRLLEKEIDGSVLGALVPPGPDGLGSLDQGGWSAAMAFARGDFGAWLQAWRTRLPAFLQAPQLLDQVTTNQIWADPPIVRLATDAALLTDPWQLAECLVQAGWLESAAQVVARLDRQADPLRYQTLRDQVGARRATLAEWKLIWKATDSDQASMHSLLERLAKLGGAMRSAEVLASPTEDHWSFASLVLPGPLDVALPGGQPLTGLAAWARGLGRLAMLGHQGGETDGTVRSVVGYQFVKGEHLGAPFEGTVFWCQGVDVLSRFERAGAPIAGAAVHAGYWIDIEVVRDDWDTWQALRSAYAPLLAVDQPFPLPPACDARDVLDRVPLLGEGTRLSLAVLRDRGDVTFEDVLAHTATHEEGHLCDRGRFLPISKNWPRALRFLVEANFNIERLMQRLEYRAELVAMCELEDPRIALAMVLGYVEANESGVGNNVTPHGSGYNQLLNDLSELAAARLDRLDQGAAWGGLEPKRTLRWQWHRIAPEALRELARELAQSEGLFDV